MFDLTLGVSAEAGKSAAAFRHRSPATVPSSPRLAKIGDCRVSLRLRMTAQQSLAALADPVRYCIVELLAGGEYHIGEIARRMPVSCSAVSQHLRVLLKIELIRSS